MPKQIDDLNLGSLVLLVYEANALGIIVENRRAYGIEDCDEYTVLWIDGEYVDSQSVEYHQDLIIVK